MRAHGSTVPAFMSTAPASRSATDAGDARGFGASASSSNAMDKFSTATIASGVFDALAARILSARDENRAVDVPDDVLEALAWTWGESAVRKALETLQSGRVRRVTAARSGRAMYVVASGDGAQGEKRAYLCFPTHFCSCRSFFWECVNRGETVGCKHQLAARLASVLGAHRDATVDDALLGNMMMKYVEGDAAM